VVVSGVGNYKQGCAFAFFAGPIVWDAKVKGVALEKCAVYNVTWGPWWGLCAYCVGVADDDRGRWIFSVVILLLSLGSPAFSTRGVGLGRSGRWCCGWGLDWA